MAELHDLTALEQAAAIRTGTVSPVELADHYLSRIDRLNDTIGAFLTVTPELARDQAAKAEAEALAARRDGRELPPLHGVPVPVKDINLVAGVRTTMGSAAYADHVADIDDHVVTRLRGAGTVMLGKTNTPEFCLPCHTENRLAPPARTPWDPRRTAGGSSGGAAAAVASGLAPLAQGTDGGGSIRIPASACGLFGFKASRGRVSGGPVQHDVTGLSTHGPLARTVADAVALLDALAGPMPGDPYAAPSLPPGESFSTYVGRDPGVLRVAAVLQPPVPEAEVHPDCRVAHEDAAVLLRDLGHQVDEVELPVDGSLRSAFVTVWQVMAGTFPVGPGQEHLLMPLTRALRERGGAVSGPQFAHALHTFRALGQHLADVVLSWYDVILSPTLAQPPAMIGGLRNDEDPAAEFAAQLAFSPFTSLYNATGLPAVSVPLHWSASGLPIGMMLAARYGDDATLVSLSAQLEAARPWRERRPALW
ncbi:amidase [Streptomyces sp. NPDC054786]